MNLKLENNLAPVTGSTAGIGLAIARTLAGEGARVIVNARSQSRVDEACSTVCQEIPETRLEGFAGDLSQAAESVRISRQFPEVKILVNTLGIYEPEPVEEIEDKEWQPFSDPLCGGLLR